MFKVGDKVQIADNIESTKLRGMAGTVIEIDALKVMYPFKVEFENGSVLFFSSAELVGVEREEMSQLDRIEKKLDRILFRFFAESMTEDGKFEKGVM